MYIKNIHKNVPGVISKINKIIHENEINIIKQYVSTQQDIGYCITIIKYNENVDKITEYIENLDVSIRTSYYHFI